MVIIRLLFLIYFRINPSSDEKISLETKKMNELKMNEFIKMAGLERKKMEDIFLIKKNFVPFGVNKLKKRILKEKINITNLYNSKRKKIEDFIQKERFNFKKEIIEENMEMKKTGLRIFSEKKEDIPLKYKDYENSEDVKIKSLLMFLKNDKKKNIESDFDEMITSLVKETDKETEEKAEQITKIQYDSLTLLKKIELSGIDIENDDAFLSIYSNNNQKYELEKILNKFLTDIIKKSFTNFFDIGIEKKILFSQMSGYFLFLILLSTFFSSNIFSQIIGFVQSIPFLFFKKVVITIYIVLQMFISILRYITVYKTHRGKISFPISFKSISDIWDFEENQVQEFVIKEKQKVDNNPDFVEIIVDMLKFTYKSKNLSLLQINILISFFVREYIMRFFIIVIYLTIFSLSPNDISTLLFFFAVLETIFLIDIFCVIFLAFKNGYIILKPKNTFIFFSLPFFFIVMSFWFIMFHTIKPLIEIVKSSYHVINNEYFREALLFLNNINNIKNYNRSIEYFNNLLLDYQSNSSKIEKVKDNEFLALEKYKFRDNFLEESLSY